MRSFFKLLFVFQHCQAFFAYVALNLSFLHNTSRPLVILSRRTIFYNIAILWILILIQVLCYNLSCFEVVSKSNVETAKDPIHSQPGSSSPYWEVCSMKDIFVENLIQLEIMILHLQVSGYLSRKKKRWKVKVYSVQHDGSHVTAAAYISLGNNSKSTSTTQVSTWCGSSVIPYRFLHYPPQQRCQWCGFWMITGYNDTSWRVAAEQSDSLSPFTPSKLLDTEYLGHTSNF